MGVMHEAATNLPKAAAIVAVIGFLSVLVPSGSASGEANPFAQMAGSWKGGGTLEPFDGAKERVICRVEYSVSGASIKQEINCAGTDYRIAATGNFTYAGGKLSGSWAESTYGASGGATGIVNGSTVFVRISGEKFTGRMKFNLSGNSHSVQIVQFNPGNGKYSTVAAITLRR